MKNNGRRLWVARIFEKNGVFFSVVGSGPGLIPQVSVANPEKCFKGMKKVLVSRVAKAWAEAMTENEGKRRRITPA